MARTTIAQSALVGPYPTLPVAADSLDLVLSAGDASNGNQTPFGSYSNLLVLVQNSGASPYTITITSALDSRNRTGDITAYSLAAGDIAAFRVTSQGWRQTDGNLYYTVSNAAVKVAVLPIG